MKLAKSLIGLSMVFTAANALSDYTPPGSEFDKIVWDSKLTETPSQMGFGSLLFVTEVLQSEEVKTAYAELKQHGRVGKITVQKVQLPGRKYKTDCYVLSAFEPTGWMSNRLSATLTIDSTVDENDRRQDVPTSHMYHVGKVVVIEKDAL